MPPSQRFDGLRSVLRILPYVPRFLPGNRSSATQLLDERAGKNPDDLALAYLDQRYTWREAAAHSNQWANFFRDRGIRSGDGVALLMDNRPDFLFALHGLSAIGAAAALINTNLSGEALVHAIRVSGARTLVTGLEHLEKVQEERAALDFLSSDGILVQAEEGRNEGSEAPTINAQVQAAARTRPEGYVPGRSSDLFCYIYTSGTTGLPKAAIISHLRILTAGYLFGFTVHRCGPGDVIYVPLPLYHSSAMFVGWASALSTGAGMALRRKFSASNFWKDAREFEATSFVYIGELCRYLLNSPVREGETSHKLRVGVGNGLRPDIWETFQQRFGIPVIREFYGATEGNTALVNIEGRPGMIGKRRAGQVLARCDQETGELWRNAEGRCEEVGVGESGLLLGRISRILGFDGYVDRDATSKKIATDVLKKGDRYFNTGDLLQQNEGGWLSFVDRVGDTFRWKGENVSTNEVAETLNGAKGVLESNVYGVKVPRSDGRAGMAALNVSGEFDLEDFARFVLEKLANYQRPYFVRLLKNDMQTTGTFKHQKVRYRSEGFDTSQIADPIYYLSGDRYVAVDGELLAAIESGEVSP